MPKRMDDLDYRNGSGAAVSAASARLYVPQSKEMRDRLKTLVMEFVADRGLTPPLSMAELDDHCREIIELSNLSSKLDDFLKILINNETWRDAVAAVPFERRTLLLPPCLRSSAKCKAEFDEFGLLCVKCGNCVLCDLSTEAEALGYAVLIAEGTSIVTELVKGGVIDAIIGVSCMHSLERTYPHVSSKAIPSLAIPLLRDGCKDTEVEVEWVREAIRLRSDETESRLSDLSGLHGEVSSWFEEGHLRSMLELTDTDTENISVSWLAKAGKRWRPFLAVSVYEALCGRDGGPLPGKIKCVAVAVECIHKASLIYDDIQDEDDCRYGEETLYKLHGVPVALTASLFLLGQGYRLLATCDAPDAERAEMLAVATGGHCELCLGQGRELNWARAPSPLSSDEVLQIFRFKTAPSFEVVFRLGAICAGASRELQQVLREYSIDIGVAYQIQDDLDDFKSGGDVDDIKSGRPSIVLALAYEAAKDDRKQAIADVWCSNAGPGGADEIREIIKSTGADEKAHEILIRYKKRALNALRPLKNRDLKIILYRVAGKILKEESG